MSTAVPAAHAGVLTSGVRRARRATAAVFGVHGAVTGSFAARVPWIAGHVGLDVGHLGVALLMPGIGAMLAMPFSARLAHRYAFRPLVAVTHAAWGAAPVLPALPTSLLLLCVALLCFGATAGLADMAMNAEGVLVEERLGFSVMSGFHGFWSAGVLAGSGISALATQAGVDTRAQFTVTAVVLALAGIAAARPRPHGTPPAPTDAPAPIAPPRPPPAFPLPTGHVLMIGLGGLCCVFAEGAGIDWSALYVRRELGGSASVAALAVSAFSVAMAGTRLVGDHAVRRLGPVLTVRAAGA